MASMPPAAGGFNPISFVAQIGLSYMLGRLSAQDGPRLSNLDAASGDYGVPIPRVFGEEVRLTGIFMAGAEIKETPQTVEDYSEIVGTITGAAQGFMIGGPVGAVVGAAAGLLGGILAPDQKYFTYSYTGAFLFADRFGDDPIEGIIKLWANGKPILNQTETPGTATTVDGVLIKKVFPKNRYYKSLTVYTGSSDQAPDAVLEAQIGPQSGYPHIAYVVIEDLQLADFGNSIPKVEGLVVAKTGQTLAEVAEAICGPAGIDIDSNLSTTLLINTTVRGYAVTSETNCWDALKPLLPVYRVDAAEVAGQIRFFRRDQAWRATIPTEHMGAHVYGDSPPEPLSFTRQTDTDLPKETSLTFIDPARDYQPNTASSKRTEGDARSNIGLSLALTLTADEGATAAATIHWDAWLGRTSATFSLTDQWIGIAPGVAYGLPIEGDVLPYRVTRKTRGANGIIEVEALSDESVTYQGTVAHTSGTIPEPESTLAAETRIVLMDMPITADAHDDFGFYVAIAGTQPYWTRGKVEVSSDGIAFATLLDSGAGAVMGDVVGALAEGTTTGLDDTLDTVSVLEVELLHSGMILSSATDAQLDAWLNFAFVGKDGLGEYIQFKTATNTGGNTWELTNLRRGRKGTDHALGDHVSGEEFVLLGGAGIYRIPVLDDSGWGDELTYRGVTLYDDDGDEVLFTNTGEGKRPYSPVDVEGSWDGSNNLTISWTYRSRMNSGLGGEDDRDEYEVEITSGAGRTLIATAAEQVVYSAANQTSDGLTPGAAISGRVRQTSDANDGRWRDFVLTKTLTADGTGATADTTTLTADLS